VIDTQGQNILKNENLEAFKFALNKAGLLKGGKNIILEEDKQSFGESSSAGIY
jgi:hypothetical protein